MEKVTLPANACTLLASFPSSDWKKRSESLAFAILDRNGGAPIRARLFEPMFKEMSWPTSPAIAVTVAGGMATFTCPVFAWNVCLDLTGEMPLADNFFDLYPGVPYSIPWNLAQAPVIQFVGNTFFKSIE